MIKKIATSHGTIYLLDEENKRVKRVPATSNHMEYDGGWTDYMSATGFVASDDGPLRDEPIEVGNRLYIKYGPVRDMPWSLSTKIVSIEEVEQ